MKKKFKITKAHLKILAIEFLFILLYFAFDLITKRLIYNPIAAGKPDINIIKGVLVLTSVENYGASFGIFSGNVPLLTAFTSLSILMLLCIWFFTITERNKLLRISLILIIAGGIGNVYDRIVYGFVRDFVYFELIDFAVFNFADSGLTIGCVLLIIYVTFFYKPEDKKIDKTAIKLTEGEDVLSQQPIDVQEKTEETPNEVIGKNVDKGKE